MQTGHPTLDVVPLPVDVDLKVLPCLVAKPSSGVVAALTGQNATTVRLGPRALGPMPPGLITPCWVVLSLDHPYSVA
jgi:hypothetical protein